VRFLFMGTAAFACPTLRKLVASPHQAVAVLTQPDRPSGRGRQLAMSAVKTCALEYHLPVLQPATLRDVAVVEELSGYAPELIVVVAYGLILPSTILALPPYGCVNLHASLLPQYRGPAPINWALINGETQTGYTIIQMDAHVDTGPILWRESCAIAPDDDASSLGVRLAERGAAGMLKILNALEQGTLTAQSQPQTGVSLAPKLTRALGRVDWQQAAGTLHNLIRGLVPWPGATGVFRDMEVKLWRATVWPHPPMQPPGTVTTITAEGLCVACGEQQLLVQEVQPANRRRMSAKEFVQGYHVQQGDRFA
jgi:methionyl-tRNA formyltransferase